MRIDIVFPVLPPTLDGIGDHTARLAEAMAAHADVRVLTAQKECEPIPGVAVETSFAADHRYGFCDLIQAVRAKPPDWLLLQYNQFSYGRWGFNPFVPLTIKNLKKVLPELQIGVLFHEDFVPVTNWKNAVMTTWQRAQFYAIGRQTDRIFFSIEPWVQRYRSWFPETPVYHAPVGSNIPYVKTDRQVIRRELGISEDTFVMGVFGSLHASRLLGHIREAAKAVEQIADDVLVLYIGPDGDQFQQAMKGLPVYDAGRLSGPEVSRHFAAMDVHLAPFIDGVSTRRGSFMVGLQHEIPSVSTIGSLTGPLWSDQHKKAVLCTSVEERSAFAEMVLALYRDKVLRKELGKAGRMLYETHFDWSVVAERIMHVFGWSERAPTKSLASSHG